MRTWILTDAYFIDWSERSPTEQVRMRPFVMMGVIDTREQKWHGVAPHAPLMPGFLITMKKNQSRKLKSVMVSEQTDQNIVIFFSFLVFQGFTVFIRED